MDKSYKYATYDSRLNHEEKTKKTEQTNNEQEVWISNKKPPNK